MKHKAFIKYKELEGKTEKTIFSMLASYEKKDDYLIFIGKIDKKDNIKLRVSQNNAIIYVDRFGLVNYSVCHKKGLTEKLRIKIDFENGPQKIYQEIEQEIYTENIQIIKEDNSLIIKVDFLRSKEQVKGIYEIKIKGEE